MTRVRSCLTLALILLTTRARAVTDATGAFEGANRLYEQGKFADAVAAYENLLPTDSASPTIHFNLGNAFFKSGQLGRAIASYRRAEQLAPRDPDVRANLQFVRARVAGPTAPPGRWQEWLGRFTVNEWTAPACVALWIFLLLLAARQLRPAWKHSLRVPVWASAAVTVALGLCLAAALAVRSSSHSAVLMGDTTSWVS